MASVTNPMKAVLNINFRNAGWSEIYILQETDYAPALVKAVQIALYRTAFFGTGVQLVFAHVSRIGADRDSVTCDLNYPLGPHPAILPDNLAPNDSVSAVQERLETAGGKWTNRMIRGLPDNYLEGATVAFPDQFRPLPSGTVLTNPTNPNASLIPLQRSFWSYLLANVPHPRKTGAYTYDMTNYVRAMPIRVSKRATGRPFGLFRGRRQANAIA